MGAHDPRLASQLQQEITKYQSQLYAESTKTTYKTHRDTYSRFCLYMGYTPVPIQPDHQLQYTAFLARSLNAASVRSYPNIIGILHKGFGLPNPLLDNWQLKSLITGINRSKGLTRSKRHPIPPPCSYSSMIGLIWKVASRPLSGLFVRLPSMACFGNPTKHVHPETRGLQNEPVLRQIRKLPKNRSVDMARKWVKTYSLTNAAVQNPKEIIN